MHILIKGVLYTLGNQIFADKLIILQSLWQLPVVLSILPLTLLVRFCGKFKI